MPKKCCRQCGKDTMGNYCSQCSPWVRGTQARTEQKIRKRDKIVTHDDDLVLDEDAGTTAYPPPKVDPYHGSTTRDDI